MMLLHQLMIFGKYGLFKRTPHHQLSMMKQDHQYDTQSDTNKTERDGQGKRERGRI